MNKGSADRDHAVERANERGSLVVIVDGFLPMVDGNAVALSSLGELRLRVRVLQIYEMQAIDA